MSAPAPPCALCGHRAEDHAGVGCHQATFPKAQISNVAAYCQCNAYRTFEQIQALQSAAYSLGPARAEVPAKIVKRILEAFG